MEKQKDKITGIHILFKFWVIVLFLIGTLKISTILFNKEAYLTTLSKAVPNNYEFIALSLNSLIVICFLMLLKLKKWAFYGVAIISIISIAISLYFENLVNIVFIVLAFGILLIVMQIKRNNISAWQSLQ